MTWPGLLTWARDLTNASDRSVGGAILIHGDSRELVPSMPPSAVDCIITSPPYGDQKNYGTEGEMGSGSNDAFQQELRALFRALYSVANDGAAFWLVLDSIKRQGQDLPLPWLAASLAHQERWSLQDTIVWDKGKSLPWSHVGHFRGQCEHILLFSKGKPRVFDLNNVRETEHLSSYWVKYPERYHPLGKAPSDLWHFPIPTQGSWASRELRHLCPFPVDLVARMIALTTREGDVVLDPFSGSGSVLVVASALGRKAAGIEFSKEYYSMYGRGGARHLKALYDGKHQDAGLRTSNQLRVLIPKLRATKYAKSLYAQLARPDRLPQKQLQAIQALIVNAPLVGGRLSTDPVRISILISATGDRDRIDDAVRDVERIPPLSKFGIPVEVRVTENEGRRRAAAVTATEPTWYEYRAGRFNSYSRNLDRAEVLEALRIAPSERLTKVPSIFSNLNLRVLPSSD